MSEELKTPKGEHAWAGYYDKKGTLLYIITSKNGNRDTYYLYKSEGEKWNKVGKGGDPLELCRKNKVYELIHYT